MVNKTKFNEKEFIWYVKLSRVQIISRKEKFRASLPAPNCQTYLEFKYDDKPSIEAISAKNKGKSVPTSK